MATIAEPRASYQAELFSTAQIPEVWSQHEATPEGLRNAIQEYLASPSTLPLLICGDASEVLSTFPSESIDFCMTSPPYWGKREYSGGGIGLETNYQRYIQNLLSVFAELKRVLKSTGSFWLNMGDSYLDKCLLGIPWRVAIEMVDRQGWILRNQVVWNKVKGGPDNSRDKLRSIHEPVFHFVKTPREYFYDVDAIRTAPKQAKIINGAVISATGVRGVRYKRQIELSTALSADEKRKAEDALEAMLDDVRTGKLADFRMVIRGQQRTTHSDSERVSGRARDLDQKGFYFLRYHPDGAKPSDVWDIIPEDTQNRVGHFAPYPEDLCRIPLLATCPAGGTALDPFAGTGTTLAVAYGFGRKSVGIDISEEYVRAAQERCTTPI
jgi:site-specific DNA-methyltransferase (adenine-specific)